MKMLHNSLNFHPFIIFQQNLSDGDDGVYLCLFSCLFLFSMLFYLNLGESFDNCANAANFSFNLTNNIQK